MQQVVHGVVEVSRFEPASDYGGPASAMLRLHAVRGERDRPEQTARFVPGIDGSKLTRRICQILIEIQSEKDKGPVALFPVHPDVGALHEAHIVIEEDVSVPGVFCPKSRDMRYTDEAVEIGDG